MSAIKFAEHALQMMAEREIEEGWVIRILTQPEFTSVDPGNSSRTRAFGRVPEFGGRWLRVVYERRGDEKRVITAFFDRKAGQRE